MHCLLNLTAVAETKCTLMIQPLACAALIYICDRLQEKDHLLQKCISAKITIKAEGSTAMMSTKTIAR